jgi:hypothetical protein
MVDISYLERLLSTLKAGGVSSYEEQGLKLYFNNGYKIDVPRGTIPTQDHTIEVPINEAELPPDLRTDNINSMDTIMNWSGSGDDGELPIPGTDIPSFTDNATHPRQERMPADPP